MSNSEFDSENFNHYAFVVDGEVGFVMPVSKNLEHINAVFASDAVTRLVPAEKVGEVIVGWNYIDGEFAPPTT